MSEAETLRLETETSQNRSRDRDLVSRPTSLVCVHDRGLNQCVCHAYPVQGEGVDKEGILCVGPLLNGWPHTSGTLLKLLIFSILKDKS